MKKINLQKFSKGSSTLEILIAFAVLILSITSVIMVGFGNQSNTVDTETNNEALYKAQAILEEARALSRANFADVKTATSTETSGALLYDKELAVLDISECKKQATSTVTWATTTPRTQKIELTTYLTSTDAFFALGGDCPLNAPEDEWNPPAVFADDTINPGDFSTLDVLNKIVYLGSDSDNVNNQHFYIADARTVISAGIPGQSGGLMVAFANSFNDDGETLNEINDIDAYKDFATGKIYAFIAMASTTAQLAVLDVTDINNPELVAKRRLSGITGSGSTAWGWRIYYYDKKVYITAREVGGPELHVFDVDLSNADPAERLKERGSKQLNTTVNDLVVRDGIGFFATETDTRGELLVYNVSNPALITEIAGAGHNFSGNEDGRSLFLLGNKLYFGRDEIATGPEFYILDASNPLTAVGGLPIIGQQEINANVTDIRIAGRFAFLASHSGGSRGFYVWNILNPTNIQSIYLDFNFGNKPIAIDYEDNFVYATGLSTPNLQILYSP